MQEAYRQTQEEFENSEVSPLFLIPLPGGRRAIDYPHVQAIFTPPEQAPQVPQVQQVPVTVNEGHMKDVTPTNITTLNATYPGLMSVYYIAQSLSSEGYRWQLTVDEYHELGYLKLTHPELPLGTQVILLGSLTCLNLNEVRRQVELARDRIREALMAAETHPMAA